MHFNNSQLVKFIHFYFFQLSIKPRTTSPLCCFENKPGNCRAYFLASLLASASVEQDFTKKPICFRKGETMSAKLTRSVSTSLGKNISPDFPRMHAHKQICPASSGETKNRFTSEGQDKGCCFKTLSTKPSNKLPLEKATLAKRAVVLLIGLNKPISPLPSAFYWHHHIHR
jgi:hypothetical protein